MKKLKKFRILIPIFAFMLALLYLCECYSYPTNYSTRAIESIYDEKSNSLDGVAFGTSVVGYGWNSPVAFSQDGLAIANFSTSVQPFGIIPTLIDFCEENHKNIKYIIIDIHALRSDAVIHSAIKNTMQRHYCYMHLGKERYDVLNASIDYAQRIYDFYGYPENEDDIFKKSFDLYVPFYTFHSRWKDGLFKPDYVSVASPYKGSIDQVRTFKHRDLSELSYYWENDSKTVDEFQKSELQRVFDYLNTKDYKVLFVNYPSFNSEDEEAELQAISKYIDECGYDMLNIADKENAEKIGLDLTTDIYNLGHVNSKASVKITKYISSYLKEKYSDTTDHRGDKRYNDWKKACSDYYKFYNNGWKKSTGEDIYPYEAWWQTTETGTEAANLAETTGTAPEKTDSTQTTAKK